MRYLILILICYQSFGQRVSNKSIEDKITKQIFDKILDSVYLKKNQQLNPWDSSTFYNRGDLVSFNGENYESININMGEMPSGAANNRWQRTTKIPGIIIENLVFKNENFDWPEFNKALKSKWKNQLDSNGRVPSNKAIVFKNCKIYELSLSGLNIEQELIFQHCEIKRLFLNNLYSNKLSVRGGSYNFILITSSTFQDVDFPNVTKLSNEYFTLNESPNVEIRLASSNLRSLSIYNPSSDFYLSVSNCVVSGDSFGKKAFSFWDNAANRSYLEIKNTTFGKNRNHSVVGIRGKFSKVLFDSCHVYSDINFYNTIVDERLSLTNNSFGGHFSINNSTLPSDLKIRWSQIKGQKISKLLAAQVFDPQTQTFGERERIISSEKDGITNLDHFEDIMQSYQVLYNNYKISGDIESANGCYSEMKDIQTKRLEYLYSQDNTFKSYFRWRLSQLMKFYTDHGTDPARAIVVSIWVVICFGVFFFFFPSDWDVTSKSSLIKNYKDFIEKNEKGYVKPFFVLILGFIVSLINAITLSLNSFTTLGFGNIPTRGIAKYFCVVEGFIGWFLLSIFTVALINQALG